ncbi:MAG: hypothetical protein CO164_13270, partial [Rhodocyclales bacterium CG_4_9_14_3_um_filter_68_10]
MLELAYGFAFHDLYDRAGLLRLDAAFLDELGRADTALRERLLAGRADAEALQAKDESELLLALSSHLDRFIGTLFGIGKELAALERRHQEAAPLYAVKQRF